MEDCKTCVNGEECSSCLKGDNRGGKDCDCVDGYYEITNESNEEVCMECPKGCLKCKGSEKCDECKPSSPHAR